MGDPFEFWTATMTVSTRSERTSTPPAPSAWPQWMSVGGNAVLDSLADGVLLRDVCGKVVFCNEAAARLLGVARRDATVHGGDRPMPGLLEITEGGASVSPGDFPGLAACSTGKAEHERLLAVKGSGTRRWVRAKAHPLFGAAGDITGSVTVFTDVTENTRMHETIRENAQRLELAMDAGNLGIWELDPNTDSGWWSPNLDRLFTLGSRTRGFAGLVAHVHPEDRFSLLTNAAKVFHGQIGDRLTLEFRIFPKQEEFRWVRLEGCLTASASGRVLRGTLLDITERRHVEEQLRKAQRLESIGRLAGGVAHDFNNLLTAMLSSLDLIDPESPELLRRDLANLREIALRGRDLTKQLLAFAKRPSVERNVIDVTELIVGVETLVRRLVGPSILLQVVASGALPVRGDVDLLEQLIVSLVVFARDTIPSGGLLSICAERQDNEGRYPEMGDSLALVTISSTSLDGVERGESAPLDRDCTHSIPTAELELESSRVIAQQHGGTLTLGNQTGSGVELTLLLPCLPTRSQADPVPTRSTRPVEDRGRVLVVDDEDVVRDNLVRIASSLGYHVQGAANAAQALTAIRGCGTALHVVLCDIGIPGPDGPSLVSLLRERAPSLRVVYMSGYTAEAESRRVDGELFLPKPFGRDELAKMLDLAFNSR